MKSYHVQFSAKAQKIFNKLDNQVRIRISNWLMNNLEGCENPRQQDIALQGNLKGKWRYRVGGYKIIAEIQDDKVVILVLDVDKLTSRLLFAVRRHTESDEFPR